jgi:hypothetical protein
MDDFDPAPDKWPTGLVLGVDGIEYTFVMTDIDEAMRFLDSPADAVYWLVDKFKRAGGNPKDDVIVTQSIVKGDPN